MNILPRTHVLYRFYGPDETLLYVGITLNPASRWNRHRDDKPWWEQVTTITIETHPSRELVLAAERTAIQTERPLYNIVHNTAPTTEPNPIHTWGHAARHMPDDCRSCANSGHHSIYHPHLWHNRHAHYTCAAGHQWTRGWAHNQTGAAPHNNGTRHAEHDAAS